MDLKSVDKNCTSPEQLMVDVTFDISLAENDASPNDQGASTFMGVKGVEFGRTKARELPALRPVCIVFKRLLYLYHLNKPYEG